MNLNPELETRQGDRVKRWRWLPARLIAAHAAALVLILAVIGMLVLARPETEFRLLVAVMLVAWLATAFLVVRPLTVMAREVGDYAAGDARAARIAITDAVERQQKLAREVHHRVKNNLQVISSLISIQSRAASDPDVSRAYGAIQIRVGALALVHRWLFEAGDVQGVDVSALAHDLCGALQQGVAATDGVELALTTRIERLYISQDAAVPLAFVITEIVAVASAAVSGQPLDIDLTIVRDGDAGQLMIGNPVFSKCERLDIPGASAPVRIINGMVRQLRGTLRFDDERSAYVIGFPLS